METYLKTYSKNDELIQKTMKILDHTRELRELENISRSGGGGCESSRTLAPSLFPFSMFPFRPGNLGLFGALLQPPAPEKKNEQINEIIYANLNSEI